MLSRDNDLNKLRKKKTTKKKIEIEVDKVHKMLMYCFIYALFMPYITQSRRVGKDRRKREEQVPQAILSRKNEMGLHYI